MRIASEAQKAAYVSAYGAAFARMVIDKQREGGEAADEQDMDGYAEEADFIGKEAARRIVVPTLLEPYP